MADFFFYNRRGFTLVELTIVIALIGILAAALLATINPVTQLKKARDSRRKQDVAEIRKALELYKNGQTPPTYPGALPCGNSLGSGGQIYMNRVPCDPVDGSSYSYTSPVGGDNLAYQIYACLEITSDRDRDSTDLCPASGRVSYTKREP